MTISGSGYNANYNPVPSTFEKQTTAETNLRNTADMGKGNVVIVSQSQSDLVPLTKLADRNTWNYKAEPERPALTPNTLLRGSGADPRTVDDGSKVKLQSLYDQLPDDIKLELAGMPTVYTAALKWLMDLAADTLDWQSKAAVKAQAENAINRTNENTKYPIEAYQKSQELGKELIAKLDKQLNRLGKNDPNYLDTKEFLTDLKTILNESSYG